MTLYTDRQVQDLALQKTLVLEGNETLAGEDAAAMEKVYASRIAFLKEEGICWWDDGFCPPQCLDPLAEYLTYFVPLLPIEQRRQYSESSRDGLKELRRLSSTSSEGAPTPAEYF